MDLLRELRGWIFSTNIKEYQSIHFLIRPCWPPAAPSIDLSPQPPALSLSPWTQVRGIMNGTTNFMLTKMEEGADYANVLAEAQALGYAEGTRTHRKAHIHNRYTQYTHIIGRHSSGPCH